MRTVAEIDADIAKVKQEMQDVHGRDTEVYARIVGYYRSVRNWNKGKREEYKHRKLFVADESRIMAHLLPESDCGCEEKKNFAVQGGMYESAPSGSISTYELFVRKTCPNCPPVKECCTNLPMSGTQIDVDTEEGIARAGAYGVFSAPTVIFFDREGNEVARAHSVKEIRALPAIRSAEPAEALS